VKRVHGHGRYDVAVCCGSGSGQVLRAVSLPSSCIVCSTCKQQNLAFALPTLRCSGCESLIRNGTNYFREVSMRSDVRLCRGCFENLQVGEKTDLIHDIESRLGELQPSGFVKEPWHAKEEEEYDHYVQCEACSKWYHYVCAAFPDPAQLPPEYRFDKQAFVCKDCLSNPTPQAHVLRAKVGRLLALQERKAAQLPRCRLAQVIESHIADELEAHMVTADDIVVRVVSKKCYEYQAVAGLRERYDSYPDGFPYVSKAIIAFQRREGRDVAFFAMYVQEYGAHCPQPNTNRTYISYLDSVRYLKTDPPDQRTLVYHSIINGYLKHAGALGYEHAHLWVEPPKSGDEYIFHCRPVDERHGTRPMSGAKLRQWYERMLTRARETRIVRDFGDIQDEIVEHLTSIRDFPMFEGDFFPDHIAHLLEDEGHDTRSNPAPPMLSRKKSAVLVDEMKKTSRGVRRRFLVAALCPPAALHGKPLPAAHQLGTELSHPMVDTRMALLTGCQNRHWQFNELRRAHYSTMMLLAHLGGSPQGEG